MEIRSAVSGFTLTIIRNESPSIDPASFTIRVEARSNWGTFTAENRDLYPSGFPAFTEQLKEFLATRSGEVVLEFTEDSELRLFRWNAKGHVGLRFKLSHGTSLGEPPRASPLTFTGQFPLDSDYLNPMYSDFVQLANA